MSRASRRPLTADNQLTGVHSEKSSMVPDKLGASPQQAMGPNRIQNIEAGPGDRTPVKENMEFALYRTMIQDDKSPTKFLLASPSHSNPKKTKIALMTTLSEKFAAQDLQMMRKVAENNQEDRSPIRIEDVSQSTQNYAEVTGPSRVIDVEEPVENPVGTSRMKDDNLIQWGSRKLSLQDVLSTEAAKTLIPEYVAYIQDKFEKDILDESFTTQCLDVDWQNHILLNCDGTRDHVEEVFVESTKAPAIDCRAKILEFTKGFFEAEAEVMASEAEEYDHLCPKVEVAIDGDDLNYGDEDCAAANRRFGTYAYVRLEKYYDCRYCKNKCFFDESLNDHLKYCRQFIHRNYNKLKEAVVEKKRSKSKIFLQQDAKLNGEARIRLDKFYYCPQSRQRYSVKSRNLVTHLKKCTHCRKPPIRECSSCKTDFPSLFRLQEHTNVVHGGMQRYRCEICNEARFRSVTQKEEHIAFYHLGIVPSYKRFACTTKLPQRCHRRFFSMADRNKHEKECATMMLRSKPTQVGQQQPGTPKANSPYRCALCKALFHGRMQFLRHSFQDHPEASGKVRVECPLCDMTFENMWQHNQHSGKCKPSSKKKCENHTSTGVSDPSLSDKSQLLDHFYEPVVSMNADEFDLNIAEPVQRRLETVGTSTPQRATCKKPRERRRKVLVLGHTLVGDKPRGRSRKNLNLGYTPVADKRPRGRPIKSPETILAEMRSTFLGHSPRDIQYKSPQERSEDKAQRSPSRVMTSASKGFPNRPSTGTKSRPPPAAEVITLD